MTAEAFGTSADGQFRVWYLGGHFGWMCSWGLLKALYVYLITIELGESPEHVGFASSSMLLVSSLPFALFGGTTVDKFGIRKILIWLQCIAGLAAVVCPSSKVISPGWTQHFILNGEMEYLLIGQSYRRGFSAAERTELRDRWQRRELLKAIGRAFGIVPMSAGTETARPIPTAAMDWRGA